MSDERRSKPRPRDQREQKAELQAARGQRRDEEQQSKADPSERGEWRGSGVCGGRHTD